MPLRQQTQPSLSDIEVGQIAALTRQIAEQRDSAQDVEWAIDGDELRVANLEGAELVELAHLDDLPHA